MGTRGKKWRRRLSRLLLGLLLLLALAYGLLHTPWARARLARTLSASLSNTLQAEVDLEGLSGWLPLRIRLEKLAITRAGDPCILARGVSLRLAPRSLLGDTWQIRQLSLDSFSYHRWLPAPPPGRPAAPLPRLVIEALRVQQLELATHLPGRPLELDATLTTVPALSLRAELKQDATRLTGDLRMQDGRPHWKVHLDAPPGSPVHQRFVFLKNIPLVLDAGSLPAGGWTPLQLDVALSGWGEGSARLEQEPFGAGMAWRLAPRIAVDEQHLPPAIKAFTGTRFEGSALLVREGGGPLRVEQLEVTGAQTALQGRIQLATDTGALTAHYACTIQDPSWPPAGGTIHASECAATGSLSRVEGKAPWQLEAQLRTTDLAGLPADLQALAGPSPELAFSARFEKGIQLDALGVEGPGGSLRAKGQVSPGDRRVALDWELDLSALEQLPALQGKSFASSLAAAGTLTGSYEQPVISARVRLPGARYRQAALDSLTVNADLSRFADGAWRGRVGAAGFARKHPLAVQGLLEASTNRYAFTELVLSAGPETRADGALAFIPGARQLEGTIELQCTELAGWSGLLGRPLAGRMDARLRFRPRPDGFGMEAEADAQGLLVDRVRLASVHVDARRESFAASQPWKLNAAVTNAVLGGLTLPVTRLSATLDAEGMDGRFDTTLQATNLVMEVSGSATRKGPRAGVVIERAEGRAFGKPLRLRDGAAWTGEGRDWTLRPLALQWGPAALDIEARERTGIIDAEVKVPALPLATLLPVDFAPVEGTIHASMHIGGVASNLAVRVRGDLLNLRLDDPDFEDFPAFSMNFQAGMSNGLLRTEAELGNQQHTRVRAEMQLPASAGLRPPHLQVERSRDLQAGVKGKLDLALFNALPTAIDQQLNGSLAVAVDLRGGLEAPHFSGTASLRDGRYEHLTLGTQLRELRFDLEADDRTLHLRSLSGLGPGQGRLSGSGDITIDVKRGFPGTFTLMVDQLRLVQNDLLRAFASGNLQLAGDARRAVLSGDLRVTPVDLHVPRYFPPAAARFEVIDPSRPALREPPSPKAKNAGSALQLAVKVSTPGKLKLEGRGLSSEWGGEVELKGSALEPNLAGSLSAHRGTFDFFGQLFRIKESEVRFTGTVPPEPRLNIVFERKKKDLTAFLRITGTSKSPVIQLDSEPVMPETELLPRLLFGKEAGELSPLQALKIARAASALRGGGSAFDLMGRMRKFLSIDQLEFEKADDEDAVAKARVGKALGERVYIVGESEIGGDANALRLEVELTPRLSLETDLQSDMKRGIGLKWKRSFK